MEFVSVPVGQRREAVLHLMGVKVRKGGPASAAQPHGRLAPLLGAFGAQRHRGASAAAEAGLERALRGPTVSNPFRQKPLPSRLAGCTRNLPAYRGGRGGQRTDTAGLQARRREANRGDRC
jgi:hypothetical protein